MESITIKVEDNLAKEMESAMKSGYATKTEFIREAIRDKIRSVKLENIRPELLKNFGKGKPKTNLTDRQVREIVGRKLAAEHGIKLD